MWIQAEQRQIRQHLNQGFSLFELLIVISIILILVTAAYVRFIAISVDAERAHFTGVMGWLQAGINMEVGRSLLANNKSQLQAWENRNPMQLVAKIMSPPSNYLGELTADEAKAAPAGHWYFDLNQGRLVYHVRFTDNLHGAPNIVDKRLKFRLKVQFHNADNLSKPRIKGLVLTPAQNGFWDTPLGRGKSRPE